MITHLRRKNLKYILTAPQSIFHKLIGIDVEYKDMVDFFRYFPLGRIHKDKTVSSNFMGQKIRMFYRGTKPAGCAIFSNGEYDLIPNSSREVLDIGAAHGDTAIFFSQRGASKVYGYELQGENCTLAKKKFERLYSAGSYFFLWAIPKHRSHHACNPITCTCSIVQQSDHHNFVMGEITAGRPPIIETPPGPRHASV